MLVTTEVSKGFTFQTLKEDRATSEADLTFVNRAAATGYECQNRDTRALIPKFVSHCGPTFTNFGIKEALATERAGAALNLKFP